MSDIKIPHYEQEFDYSCLVACTRMILAHYGQEYKESFLRGLLKTRRGGTSPANLLLRLPQIGFSAGIQSGSQSFLQRQLKSGTPCIVHVWTAPLTYWQHEAIHAMVVVGIEEAKILVHDPALANGPTAILLNDFLQAWAATDYLTIVINPLEEEN